MPRTGRPAPFRALFVQQIRRPGEIRRWLNPRRGDPHSLIASKDALTRLPSRDSFRRELDARIVASAPSGSPESVLLLGIEDFRQVNSTYGHESGDAILVGVGARMTGLVGQGWCVARSTGDVFAALPPAGASGSKALPELVEQLVDLLADPFELTSGVGVQLSGRIGVAVSGAEPTSAAVLLRNAKIALYRAKADHRAWVLYDAIREAPATRRLAQIAELREAINAGELRVHYQPVVDLSTGHATSVEALLRWLHPTRGLILPNEFIALAEQCGLIRELTEFVVSTVSRQTGAWERVGRSLPCAVNLSVRCLVDSACSERLVSALTAMREAVTVEVTESAFADERAVAALQLLAAGGVACTIDDFGTGYACLASLKNLPVRTLKIDRSFIQHAEVDGRDLAIIEAILALAKALNLDVIAEGIENEATAAQLRRVGVLRGQGFWLARPMPADELDAWLGAAPLPAGQLGSPPCTVA